MTTLLIFQIGKSEKIEALKI